MSLASQCGSEWNLESHLVSNVCRLVANSHPGDPRKVNQGQVWNTWGADIQANELITDPQPFPSNEVLSWEEEKKEKSNEV